MSARSTRTTPVIDCLAPGATRSNIQVSGARHVLTALALFLVLGVQSVIAQIPEGFEVVRITNDPDSERKPSLNNCGQFVFSKRIDQSEDGEEIFLFDNGTTTRITDDDTTDALPDINDWGTIIYTHAADGFGGGFVTVHRNGISEVLFEGFDSVINNRHQFTWLRFNGLGCRGSDADAFWFDGEEIRQLTENEGSNQVASINDDQWIGWNSFDFCSDPWTSKITLHVDGETVALEARGDQVGGPSINNVGQVAWGGGSGLELWENGQAVLLTDWAEGPKLNDLGSIYFVRWHEDVDTWNSWLYSDGQFYQLTHPALWEVDGDINNDGEIVWGSYDIERWPIKSDLYHMRRIRTGDSEFDGDIDHDDLTKLVECMTGPMWVERTGPGPEDSLCQCRFLDINHDGSVDLRDYTIFQQNYSE